MICVVVVGADERVRVGCEYARRPNPARRGAGGAFERAVRAVLDGMSRVEAAEVFDVHPNAVSNWMRRYRQGGWAGLAERCRGRRPSEQLALDADQ